METTSTATACDIPAIEAQLRGRLRGQIHQLRVIRHDDGLILQGNSRTYHAKQLAQHGLMKATAVPLLANEIEVDA